MTVTDKRLQSVLQEHFDPKWGSHFWLERRSRLNFDPLNDVVGVDDLYRFGPTPVDQMATRPIEDFIPRKHHDKLHTMVVAETGGTSGAPKRTAYLQEEFEEAFVLPFVAAARRVSFPRALHWLYIGPSGPHIIGKAARACAAALGSMDPFTVDFDPRWVRKLPTASMSHNRYVEHVLAQSTAILMTQHIGILFGTPPILASLGERLPENIRANIRGVHLGGLPSDVDVLTAIETKWFPNAVVLGGYGNTLAGLCPQISSSADGLPEYCPHGNRLVVETVHKSDGLRGRVIFHRLDRSTFLPNVLERDEAECIEFAQNRNDGFQRYGLRDPRPAAAQRFETEAALY